MTTTAIHSIGKLSFHLKGVQQEKVFAMRQQAASYLQHNFKRLAEEVFADFDLDDELLFIDRVSIDLQVNDSFDLQKIKYRLREQIREQVATHVQQQKKIIVQHPNDIEQKSVSADPDILLQAWAFYLEHGHLPSYISFELWQERLSWWKKSATPIDKQLRSFFIQQLHDEQRLKRFLKHGTFEEQQWIFNQLHRGLNVVLKEGKLRFKRSVPFSYFEIKTYLLYLFADENNHLLQNEEELPTVEWVMDHNELYQRSAKHDAEQKKTLDKKKSTTKSNDEAIIVHNAGIVLLQPFISTLFHELHLLSEDRKSLIDKDRACALLSFLAGDEEHAEIYYPLCKLICGFQPHEFVDANVELTIAQKEECFHLLQQMIVHWPAIKQTSVPSLQQSFFQRTGKLSLKENKWLLQVEQRTEDVLLQYLPWSYSIIRYPWMKQALFVEWM
jgi:hypothetical protein